jgi:glycine betaine/proline transport system permease protein
MPKDTIRPCWRLPLLGSRSGISQRAGPLNRWGQLRLTKGLFRNCTAVSLIVLSFGLAWAGGDSAEHRNPYLWLTSLPRVPIGPAVEKGVDWITLVFGPEFSAVAAAIGSVYEALKAGLLALPPAIVGGVLVIAVWKLAGRSAGIFAVAAVLLINSIELWPQTMSTFALMSTAVIATLGIGIPIGIAAAQSSRFEAAINPLLDFMQTMPPFVYLIPAVIMFGIGPVPGILATVFYAVPVPIRLTDVGIRQVSQKVIEAGEAFGCSPIQLLFKIKLPLALPVIITGVNQTVMYSLGMVIVASMIGAGGLGAEILRGITRLQLGAGFEAGLAVVFVAILLDQLGRGLANAIGGQHRKKTRRTQSSAIAEASLHEMITTRD